MRMLIAIIKPKMICYPMKLLTIRITTYYHTIYHLPHSCIILYDFSPGTNGEGIFSLFYHFHVLLVRKIMTGIETIEYE